MAEAEELPPASDVRPTTDTSTDYEKALAASRMTALYKDIESQRQRRELLAADEQKNIAAQKSAYEGALPGVREGIQQEQQAIQPIMQQQPPTLPQPPKLQNFLDKNTAQMMLGVGSLMAGLNTNGRMRGIRANQSLAAGINGYVNGNFMMAKLGLEDWKNQVETQIDQYKLIRQNNLDILTASGKNLEAKMLDMQLELKKYGFDDKMIQSKLSSVDDIVKFDTDMADIITKMESVLAKTDPAILELKRAEMAHKERMMQSQERIAGIREETAKTSLEKARQNKAQKEKDQKTVEHLKMTIGTEQKTLDQMLKEEKSHGGMDAFFDVISGGAQVKKRKQAIKDKQNRIAELQQKMNNLVLQTQVRDAVADSKDIEVGEPLELP